MKFIYKDTSINYEYFDNDSKTSLVFLHGWGQNIEMMMPLAKPFIKKYNCLIVDLPGFGKSEEPKSIWTIYDYADAVNELIKELKIKNSVLIGHSFGGKISLAYGIKYNPNKLILLASPYRKHIEKDGLKLKILKFLKKVPIIKNLEEFAKKHIGSTDYKNASETMRKVLVEHVNLDLSDEVKKIKCPTLLIWGTKDMAVSIEDARLLETLIPNCGLVEYEDATHYAYLERLVQTKNVLISFIESEDK